MRVAKELSPNFTGFPNVLTDRLMAAAGPTRWMLISVIVRKTYGWHLERAPISLSTFQDCTGLGRKAVVDRLRQMETAGLLERTESTKGTLWELNLDCDPDEVLLRLASQSGSPIEPLPSQSGSPIEPLASSPIEPLDVFPPIRVFKESIKENKNLSRAAENATREGDENEGWAPDPRHAPLRQAIQAFQRAAVGSEIWDGRCAGALARLLKSRGPGKWPLERLLECAAHRFASDVNHAMTPAVWLAQLTDYANGPLDRYGKPVALPVRDAPVGVRRQPQPKRNIEADLAAFEREMVELGGAKIAFESWRGQLRKAAADAGLDRGSFETWLAPLRPLGTRADGMTILLAPCDAFGHVREKYGDVVRSLLDGADFEIWAWDETAEGNPWAPI